MRWIDDDRIVSLHPDGPTSQCAGCVSSGTFTVAAFDQSIPADSNTKLGLRFNEGNFGSTWTQSKYWVYVDVRSKTRSAAAAIITRVPITSNKVDITQLQDVHAGTMDEKTESSLIGMDKTDVGVAPSSAFLYRGERHWASTVYSSSQHDSSTAGTYEGPLALIQVVGSTFTETAFAEPASADSQQPKWESKNAFGEPPTLTIKASFLAQDGTPYDGLGCHLDVCELLPTAHATITGDAASETLTGTLTTGQVVWYKLEVTSDMYVTFSTCNSGTDTGLETDFVVYTSLPTEVISYGADVFTGDIKTKTGGAGARLSTGETCTNANHAKMRFQASSAESPYYLVVTSDVTSYSNGCTKKTDSAYNTYSSWVDICKSMLTKTECEAHQETWANSQGAESQVQACDYVNAAGSRI